MLGYPHRANRGTNGTCMLRNPHSGMLHAGLPPSCRQRHKRGTSHSDVAVGAISIPVRTPVSAACCTAVWFSLHQCKVLSMRARRCHSCRGFRTKVSVVVLFWNTLQHANGHFIHLRHLSENHSKWYGGVLKCGPSGLAASAPWARQRVGINTQCLQCRAN